MLNMKSPQSNGGIAKAKKIRDSYNENPNKCKYCNLAILHVSGGLSDTRKKVFCNKSCAAKYNNALYPKRKPIVKPEKDTSIRKSISFKTKAQLFKEYANWQSARSTIQKNARAIFLKEFPEPACNVCGYTKHIEVCHIQSVSSFPDETLILTINDITNLFALCPTHHWEFDNRLST